MKVSGLVIGGGGALLLYFAMRNQTSSSSMLTLAAAGAAGPAPLPGLPAAAPVRAVVAVALPLAAPAPAPVLAPPPIARPIAKLGNSDPAFESWLSTEVQSLMGPFTSRAQDVTFLKGAIRNRHIPDYYKNSPGDCGTPPQLGSLGVVQEAGSFAGAGLGAAQLGVSLAGTAFKALPIVGAAIGVFEAAYSLAFAPHQQAVRVEQNTLCNAIPLANQYMDQIDSAYRAGQISGLQVDAALDALYTKFLELVAGIVKPTPFSIATSEQVHVCNAACVYARALRGIIDAKERFDY